jgi:hypothetical protein
MLKIKALLFSERVIIENEFLKWAEKNNIATTPKNVIAFLEMNKMIDINKSIKFLEKVE